MKKIIYISLLALILFSCTETQESNTPAEQNSAEKPYYEFDELYHYQSEVRNNIELLLSKDTLTFLEQLKMDAYFEPRPHDINDSLFLNELVKVDFVKRKIANQFHSKINNIFSLKKKKYMEMQHLVSQYSEMYLFLN